MGLEYKLQFRVPEDYDPTAFLKKLPSQVHRSAKSEIYTYRVEKDGFYFLDYFVDETISARAFKQFVNEALRLSSHVQLFEP